MGPPIRPLRTPVRALVAILAAAYMAQWVYAYRSRADTTHSDFGQVWYAAGAVLRGANPYELIGPGLAYDWAGHFYYPLTAALVAVPFAVLPLLWAEVAFAALSAAVLAWLFTRYGIVGVLMLASPSVTMALQLGQWSPLFTAALFWPVLGMLFAAKPTIGAAYFAARPTRWAVLGGAALVIVSLTVQPSWPFDWFGALRSTDVVGGGAIPYAAPITTVAGAAVALAALRWRQPEARLLLTLACVPQTPIIYETLPLLLIARTTKQALWFVAAGWLVIVVENVARWRWHVPPLTTNAVTIPALFYLPALLMVLRRPNEGSVPAWVERWLVRARTWLAGQAPEAA